MQNDTLEKTYVKVKGEIVAGGPVRKIYTDEQTGEHWLRCTSHERDVLNKHGYLAPERVWCDIIVVKYGQPDLERRCLDSVRKHTDLNKHRLTDVDNKFIDKNLGALWNDLISASEAPFVCLLNTDTVVEPDWIENMLEAAVRSGADAVGPMTDKCGINYQVGEKTTEKALRDVPQLSGFCVLIRKRAWARVGGFPEFFPFYGQESDLMDRIGTKVVARHVFVHHDGGGTIKKTVGRDFDTEKMYSMDVYKKVRLFNWKDERLLVLGSGQGNHFPLWRGIDQACDEFNKRGGHAVHLALESIQNDDTMQFVREYNPTVSLVVCTNPTRLIESAPALKHVPGHRALWHNDLRSVNPDYVALHGVFRALFMCWSHTNLDFDLERWNEVLGAPTMYMPQGSVINPYLKRAKEQYRALFIGGTTNGLYHTGRAEFFSRIGATVVNEFARSKRLEVEKRSTRLYRAARYSFGFSPTVPGYNSLRLYNMLAYGGLVLVRNFQGLSSMFKPGEHLFTFKGISDAEKLMQELDAQPELREQVARNGWRLQQAKHTGLWRIMNMIANLRGDPKFWGNL